MYKRSGYYKTSLLCSDLLLGQITERTTKKSEFKEAQTENGFVYDVHIAC